MSDTIPPACPDTEPVPGPIYGGVDVPEDVWGLDTMVMGALTDEQLRALAEVDLGAIEVHGVIGPKPQGRPRVLEGYCPFYDAAPSKWDWSEERIRAACDAGFLVGVVQHPRGGLWTASAELGLNDGKTAAEFAARVGYPTDCHLAFDDEAVANPGPDAVAHVYNQAKGYSEYGAPATYEGYEPGLSQLQQYEDPYVTRYWGAYGAWEVAVRSVCCRQGPTLKINGVAYDLDHFFADKKGGVMRLMGRVDLWMPKAA